MKENFATSKSRCRTISVCLISYRCLYMYNCECRKSFIFMQLICVLGQGRDGAEVHMSGWLFLMYRGVDLII